MLVIRGNEISISRGDDAVIELNLFRDGLPAPLQEGDKIIFTVKQIGYEAPIIYKELTEPQLVLSSIDTEDLSEGTYEYDFKLIYATGEKVSLIYPSPFEIKEVV